MRNILKINEVVFASIICIFAYGLYGIGSPSLSELNSNIIACFHFISPIVALVIYFILQPKYMHMELNLFLVNKIFLVKLVIFFFIALFIVSYVNLSLSGDQLYYSNYAFIHSIKLLPALSSFIPSFLNIEFATLIKASSLFLAMTFALFCYFIVRSYKFNYLFFLFLVIFSVLFLRLIIAFLGGNPIVHAPLSSAYLMLLSPILGISDIGLQVSFALSFVFFGYLTFLKFFDELNNTILAGFITLSLFTIPGFFFLGSTIEPSIFTIICFSLVLFSLTDNKFINYKNLIYMIVFFSFFRIAAIFAILPIIAHIILNKNLKSSVKNNVIYLIDIFNPVVLFLPFFLFAYISGSASTSDASFSLIKLWNIVLDGTMWNLYADTLSQFLLGMYLFFIIITIRSKFTQINIIFLFMLSVIFFSINESLWTFAKYRLEVFIPLFFSQTLFIIKKLRSKHMYNNIFIIIASTIIIFINTKNLAEFPEQCSEEKGFLENNNMRYKIDHGCNYLSRIPYSYERAINYVSEKNKLSATYLPGVNYGAFIHILNNAKISGFLTSQKIWDRQEKKIIKTSGGNFGANPEFINSDEKIQYVILAFTQDLEHIKNTLINFGWTEELTYINKYGLSVYLLKRNTEHD